LFEGGGDGGVGVGMVVVGVHAVVVVERRGGREVVLMMERQSLGDEVEIGSGLRVDGSGSHAWMYLCQCVWSRDLGNR